MKPFTARQESHIRERLDSLMQCGTAHIFFAEVVYESTDNASYYSDCIDWYTVRAVLPYALTDCVTGEQCTDDKTYEISVGMYPDRRRQVLTALDLSQHDRRRGGAA